MQVTYEERDGTWYRIVEYDNGATMETSIDDYTETVRVDSETVEDVLYVFDRDTDEYVEQSRTPRHEPQPPSRVDQLEEELLLTQLALVEFAEAQEQDQTDTQLALAELAELLLGGVE